VRAEWLRAKVGERGLGLRPVMTAPLRRHAAGVAV